MAGPKKPRKYNPQAIEKKWQKYWAEQKFNRAVDPSPRAKLGRKFYCLVEFPYPSGEGLHVGHIRSYAALDVLARKRRAEGFNVLYPMGWDAFGLPTENYAIKTGQPPAAITKRNINRYRKQLQSLGFSFDWSREVNTTDPNYYHWTQWLFLQLFKAGLAYKKQMPINWCLSCKIGLANEEVVDNKCERCGGEVETREKEQWMLAITKYADRLDKDLDLVDYPEAVKTQQRNWIGRKEGWEIEFQQGEGGVLKVFTTRPETIFGVTFIARPGKQDRFTGEYAINPASGEAVPIWEAEYVMSDVGTGAVMGVPAHDERDYEFARKHGLPIREVIVPEVIDKDHPPKSGYPVVERQVVHAIVRNPKTDQTLLLKWKKFPWTTLIIGGVEKEDDGDIVEAARREILEETGFKNLKYVKTLGGVVRAQFFAAHKNENRLSYTNALVFDLIDEEREKVSDEELTKHDIYWGTLDDVYPCAEIEIWKERYAKRVEAYTGQGILINSGEFSRLDSNTAGAKIMKLIGGKKSTTYRLRDWIFSRQRYWGEPIPLVFCPACAKASAGKENGGWVAVPDKNLPVKLPPVKKYEPTDTGESPLATMEKWAKTECPVCGGPARRETDTMPNWAGSAWYYLRYCDPYNKKTFASQKKMTYWLGVDPVRGREDSQRFSASNGVDWYNGGMEHTTLHLLYSRFWHKAFYDLGLVPGSEPYAKRTYHGLILAADGEKMSKSRGNVVNPDEIIKRFGADTLRVYELFMGPFDQAIGWNENGLVGVKRFLERVWKLVDKDEDSKAISHVEVGLALEQTVAKISQDIEGMKYNTAISALMIMLNSFEKAPAVTRAMKFKFLQLLAPFAPHLAEELWWKLGNKRSIFHAPWPRPSTRRATPHRVKIVIQINGKRREVLEAPAGLPEAKLKELVLAENGVRHRLAGKKPLRIIVVPNRLINIVLT